MRAPVVAALVVWSLALPVRAERYFDEDGATAVVDRVNALRKEEGLAPLSPHAGLTWAAREHAEALAERGELVHVTEEAGDPASRASEAGVEAADLVQHIAHGAAALDAHRSLVDSDPHRARLLDPELTHIGVAVVVDGNGAWLTELLARIEASEAAAEPADEEPAPEPADEEPAPEPADEEAPLFEPEPPPPEWRSGPEVEVPAHPDDPGAQVRVPGTGEGSRVVVVLRPRSTAPGRRVVGYWVSSGGRWWYFPRPPDARPGQELFPDPSVQGPPPGVAPATQVVPSSPPRVHVRVLRPASRAAPRPPGVRVRVLPWRPTPPFGWSPRRHYWRWRLSR
ncbi:MAG: CAP domain-containing protein [Myxococcota bacterium]